MSHTRTDIQPFLCRVCARLGAKAVTFSITSQGFHLVRAEWSDGRSVEQRFVFAPKGEPGWVPLEHDSSVERVARHLRSLEEINAR